MKKYSKAPDADAHIERVQLKYHERMKVVTVGALFVFDDEDSAAPMLNHGGYPAQAVVRITPLKERTLGVPDAVVVIDRACWQDLTAPQRDALVDHELTHLEMCLAKDSTTIPKCDALGRPKLKIRKHDYQFGWFDIIAERHGDASPEKRQARQLLQRTRQLYFDFAAPSLEAAPEAAADDAAAITSNLGQQILAFAGRRKRRDRDAQNDNSAET